MHFPRESSGGLRHKTASFTSTFITSLLPAKFLREPSVEQGLSLTVPVLLALLPSRPEHCICTENMSKASGLKLSICYKKNEVFKQGLFGVGGCQMEWGLPGSLHHMVTYEQISPGLENML